MRFLSINYVLILFGSLMLSHAAMAQNRPPTIDDIPNYGPIKENAGLQIITLTGIGPGRNSEKQTVSITASSDNEDLIPEVAVQYDQGETAVLSFKSNLDANGKAKITVVLDDGQTRRNITKESFDVSVYAVNGKPSFQLYENMVSVDENSGGVDIANFAINIDDGDPEDKQKIEFTTTITNITGDLSFMSVPEISEKDGDLKFECDPNKFGEALISVVLEDDGGTKNGGINVSDVSTFTIKVLQINDLPTLDDIPGPFAMVEDGGEQTVKLSGISGGNNEGQDLLLTAISDIQELIPDIRIDYVSGETTALLSFASAPNSFGNANITVTVSNGQSINQTISKQFLVVVNPVADTPNVTDAILEGGSQTASGLVISRNPFDTDEVTHFKINNIQKGTLFLHDGVSEVVNNDFVTYQEGNAGLKFTVADAMSGFGSFDVQAATGSDDAMLGGGVVSARIIVENDAPSIISVPDTIVEISKSYVYDIEVIDSNETDILTFTIDLPQSIQIWLKVIDNDQGGPSLFGSPPPESEGIYKIHVKVEDQLGAYDEQSFNLTVISQNKKPELTPFSVQILEDENIYFKKEDFSSRFYDADGDTLCSIRVTSPPQFGTLQLNGNVVDSDLEIGLDEIQNIVYIPNEHYFGLDIFDWNASDGKDFAIVPKRVNIFISSVNDPPEIVDFETEPMVFEYGDDGITITNTGLVLDADGDKLVKALVRISQNYIQGEDSIFYEAVEDLTFNWQDSIGVLAINGIATTSAYQDVLRSLKYINTKRLAPNGNIREVEIVLFDPHTMSIPYLRKIYFEDTFVDLGIPNAFTPNGDEVNDTWSIENLYRYGMYEITVYSRSGLIVFKSSSQKREWDGRYNGEVVPVGNYYYLININKFEKSYTGTIFVLK